MTLGVVMLVHTALDRAAQAIRHWGAGGCPVVVHVDHKVDDARYSAFVAALADVKHIRFSKRFRCEWGTWGIVVASQAASTVMLAEFPDVRHVYLASGACLPLRPIAELRDYLDARPDSDFIESATTADVPWTVGGLDEERFVLRFPFSWKNRRRLFDRYVKIQMAVGFKRKIPAGLEPHMGSQWWCLTRRTLGAILNDPNRPVYDRYFRKVWIPDESYYQTLVRLHSNWIESRSLTLSKFDFQGKPHVFYDDHLELLRRSDCFVARKIWPQADLLYRAFPRTERATSTPNTATIDRIFTHAVIRRTRGRPGLYMQSCYPHMDRENGFTATPYSVLQGFDDIMPDFTAWLSRQASAEVHGHLYASDRAHFAGGEGVFRGGQSDSAKLRDYNGKMFLTDLIWNGRTHYQCFQFGPKDTQDISWMIAKDTNALISVVTGAWAIPLFRSGRAMRHVRKEAARLQQIEYKQLKILRSPYARARIHICSLSEFVAAPVDALQLIVDQIARYRGVAITELPAMADLTGFGEFLQDLKNQGMHPFLTGDFPIVKLPTSPAVKARKPYVAHGK
ncbi:beta-1,6-N-acetylglucosaminyltransferase [Yoonia sp.]|jgi:hypothetical protein|uniref:DUF5927 domain-containing protein n=1 Tax=Yoonia sp. TaxID=2212373 RepID=UPI0025D8FB93|nr:beta-1,6-N-acetylglucosaminyltransferase [Yoonia sp.]